MNRQNKVLQKKYFEEFPGTSRGIFITQANIYDEALFCKNS